MKREEHRDRFVPPLVNRRNFMHRCMTCAAGAAAWRLLPSASFASGRAALDRPRVRLVFCETSNTQPIWPNVGYDFDHRRKEIVDLLARDCPGIEFLQAKLMDRPEDLGKVLEGNDDVDGYLVCVQGLGWSNDIFKLCTTGKPTLLVDNLFGGSGKFLTQIARIMKDRKPVDWVSSSRDGDIAASARHFAGLKEGLSADEIAAAFRATRGERTPKDAAWECRKDPVSSIDVDRAVARLAETKILVVGGGWGGEPFRKAALEVTGVTLVPITFEEISKAYDEADRDEATVFARRWIEGAEKVIDVEHDEIERSGVMYVAMRQLIEKHGAMGISVNCLGGFYGGHVKAYPCLGFCQLNNDGLVGGCEADQMSALTMAMIGVLTGRPGFISDPVIDTAKNAIVYAHCVAMTRPFGSSGASNPYHIMTHSEDRKGASMRSLLPEGYMTTTLEIDPRDRTVLIHRAKTIGNNPSDMACRTKLEAVVKGDLEKLTENWAKGWHRVTFFGDLKEEVYALSDALSCKVVEEA